MAAHPQEQGGHPAEFYLGIIRGGVGMTTQATECMELWVTSSVLLRHNKSTSRVWHCIRNRWMSLGVINFNQTPIATHPVDLQEEDGRRQRAGVLPLLLGDILINPL